MGVVQPRPQIQTRHSHSQRNHQSGAENNTTNQVISSSPLIHSLPTNDGATSISTFSSRDSAFDCREYDVDLVLSAVLTGDKQQNTYDHDPAEDTATTEPEPDRIDSTDQHNER